LLRPKNDQVYKGELARVATCNYLVQSKAVADPMGYELAYTNRHSCVRVGCKVDGLDAMYFFFFFFFFLFFTSSAQGILEIFKLQITFTCKI
jgi:hypothetical protein